MRARAVLVLTAATAAVALPVPASACACGVAPQARIALERALVVHDGRREDLVISYDLRAAGARPAVVLPVPSEPAVTAVKDDPFAWLERVTARPVATAGGDDEGAAGAAPRTTIRRSTVGGYSVTRLHGGGGRVLDRWLRRNGYALPAGAAPILERYVRRGWWFVALRLAKRQDGALKPLRLRFASARPVYPMRLAQLATQPVNLDLYAVAGEQLEAEPLARTFSRPLTELPEAAPASLRLPAGATLTKLEAVAMAPTAFRDDVWLEGVAQGRVVAFDESVWAQLVTLVARL
ncbi:MAG TPA: DUF2330 domain-containing protein [Solirubrobacteraceae bacterium]